MIVKSSNAIAKPKSLIHILFITASSYSLSYTMLKSLVYFLGNVHGIHAVKTLMKNLD
jgi:hypothetical protein